ncbi:hypothetical protein FHS81_001758 [Pseudochelatococcus contaminans]|uniref:Uncharacterized protein n=1 Tax=Pseudochelatococcus contaminans TaxID=1538103 RepID=A0A7W6EGV1_9HYPH|nr:hypothetical protein [Pseudochelatococcus contaminans]
MIVTVSSASRTPLAFVSVVMACVRVSVVIPKSPLSSINKKHCTARDE